MTFLEYPVTRPIPLTRSAIIGILLGAGIFTGLVTVINVIAVGYELVTTTSSDFNATVVLWYDHFLPSTWRPNNLICQPAVINLNEGCSNLYLPLKLDISTHNQFTYT